MDVAPMINRKHAILASIAGWVTGSIATGITTRFLAEYLSTITVYEMFIGSTIAISIIFYQLFESMEHKKQEVKI